MEIRVIGRGALAGFIAGVLGFVFARIFAEPLINKAIDYESGRHDALTALNQAAGRPVAPDGPEIFSRTIQSAIGMFSGIVAFSTAMGALVGVAYLVLHGRFTVRPQTLAASCRTVRRRSTPTPVWTPFSREKSAAVPRRLCLVPSRRP